jgi:hypothetical protein
MEQEQEVNSARDDSLNQTDRSNKISRDPVEESDIAVSVMPSHIKEPNQDQTGVFDQAPASLGTLRDID